MSNENKTTLTLKANKDPMKAALDDAGKDIGKFGSIAQTALGVFSGQALLDFGKTIVGWGKNFMDAASGAEQDAARLAAVFDTAGNKSGFASDQAEQLAGQLHKLQFVSMDAARSATALMGSFENVRGDVFQDALTVAGDAAHKWGVSVEQAASTVGRALNDPMMGMRVLRREGIIFSEEQEEVINKLVATGRGAEAQAIILERLKGSVEGASDAYGKTFAGQMTLFQETLDNAAEAIGGLLLGALDAVMPYVVSLADYVSDSVVPAIEDASEVIGEWAGQLLDWIAPALESLGEIAGNAFGMISDNAMALWDAASEAFTGLDEALKSWGGSLSWLADVAEEVFVGYISTYVGVVSLAIETAWSVIEGTIAAIGEGVMSLWNDYFAPATGGIEGNVTSLWDTLKEWGGWLGGIFIDGVIGALTMVQVAFENLGDVMALYGLSATLSLVKVWEQIKWTFGEVVPELLRWFADNWRDIFSTLWNGTSAMFTNMFTNVKNFFAGIWSWIKGDGFDFKWTGLLDGFESTLKELPNIVDRHKGDLEQALEKEVGELGGSLGSKFEKKYAANMEAFSARKQGVKDAVTGGTKTSGGDDDAAMDEWYALMIDEFGGEGGADSGPQRVKGSRGVSNAPMNFSSRPMAGGKGSTRADPADKAFTASWVGFSDLSKQIQQAAAGGGPEDKQVKAMREVGDKQVQAMGRVERAIVDNTAATRAIQENTRDVGGQVVAASGLRN